jgi:hypothetical protein
MAAEDAGAPPLLAEYVRTLEAVMSSESDLMRAVFAGHRGKLGENREALVQRFFQTYLPSRFRVTTGFALVGPRGVSTQQDLVIYDAANHPVLFPDSPSELLPPAAINAVIEVKTRLDATELRAAVAKAASLKAELRASLAQHPQRRERTLEPLACIMAFGAADRYISEIPQQLKLLEEEDNLEIVDRLDLVCVLGQGVVIAGAYRYRRDNAEVPPTSAEHPQGRIALRSENALLIFYSALLDYISAQTPLKPQMMSYLPPDYGLGVVDGIA